MPIALISPDETLLREVGDILTGAGAGELYCVTAGELLRGTKNIAGAQLVFLILATQDKVKISDWIDQTRQRMGQGQRLVLCVLLTTELELFRSRGADEVINPAGPDERRVAERILGHLILKRHVTPHELEGIMLGGTPPMRELYRKIEKVAPRNGSVLILGETGTGKELVALAIHKLSGRSGAFKKIVCPEMSGELMGSELFGHLKGSYSGADRNRPGLIRAAQNGTAFMDEIGELERSMQLKLLDVVQWARVRPVGSDDPEPANARFVFATNADLQKLIRDGNFRRDLFERINVHVLKTPPLRERMADIPLLVEHFVSQLNAEGRSLRLKDGAVDVLFRHKWPNNVRELENVVVRAAGEAEADEVVSEVMLRESITRPEKPPGNYIEFDPRTETWPQFRDRAEATYFRALDEIPQGSKERIKLSGMGDSQYHKIRGKHGLGPK